MSFASIRLRRDSPEEPKARGGVPDAASRPSRKRRHDFPNHRCSVVGVLGHQFVEERRTAAWHARDKDRTLNRFRVEARALSPGVLEEEPRLQKIAKVNPCKETSEWMQVGLSFKALYQYLQTKFNRRIVEVRQPCRTPRTSAQRIAVQRP